MPLDGGEHGASAEISGHVSAVLPVGGEGINCRTVGPRGHDEMHAKLGVIEVVDQHERRVRDRVDVETELIVDRLLGVVREVLLDGVIDAGKCTLRDSDSECFPGSWDTDARLCLKAIAPRPCTVLAVVIEGQVS